MAPLNEAWDLRCHKCGKPGPDTFGDLAGAQSLLGGAQLTAQARIVTPPVMLRTISRADVEACRPEHRKCPQPRPARPAVRAPYDLLRSVR